MKCGTAAYDVAGFLNIGKYKVVFDGMCRGGVRVVSDVRQGSVLRHLPILLNTRSDLLVIIKYNFVGYTDDSTV